MSGNNNPPPGWYDNPSGEGNLRYWSGKKWMDHFQDKPALSAPPPAPPQPTTFQNHAEQWSPPPRVEVPLPDPAPEAPDQPTDERTSTEPNGPLVAKGHNGTVVFDGDFVTISRKGALARLTVGKGDKRIPVGSITAVQWKPPGAMVNGFISFTLGGGNERRSKFGSQTRSAVDDENSIIIMKKQVADFETLRAAVERVIAERGRPRESVQAVDPVAQLKQLAELHQAGVLTDEEFAGKKASLMERF